MKGPHYPDRVGTPTTQKNWFLKSGAALSLEKQGKATLKSIHHAPATRGGSPHAPSPEKTRVFSGKTSPNSRLRPQRRFFCPKKKTQIFFREAPSTPILFQAACFYEAENSSNLRDLLPVPIKLEHTVWRKPVNPAREQKILDTPWGSRISPPPLLPHFRVLEDRKCTLGTPCNGVSRG